MQNWVQRRSSDRDLERRTRQIKEIVRIGTALRADMELESILAQIVEAITSTLGFGAAVLNLAREESALFEVVATAGLGEAERQRLLKAPPPVARLLAVMRPEFCISHSYFISHHYKHLLDGVEGVTLYSSLPPGAQRAPDAWHPEDVLFVPLISPRGDRLLGILSLDQPEDGKVPSLDSIEILELFASQAALAIDTARVFQEREAERQALESGLFELLYHLEQVRQGNMDVRVQLSGTALSPMAESLNAVVQTLGALLKDVREASDVVSRNAADMREAAAQLAAAAQQQAQQILDVSTVVGNMAESAGRIANTAADVTTVAHDAMEISNVGREAAERAAEGMSAVREMVLQSVKKMKRLGESAQDIGEIVAMVADFASQTNLLALNAAIEAARAGENGRGFSIVAQEIRNLATSSAEATKQIHARIRGIQTETNNVVVTIEHSTQQVVLQSELAAEAGTALEEVDSVMQRIAGAISDMNAIATEQAEAAVTASLAIAGIAQISTQTRDSMQEMSAEMDHLVELAHSLLRSINVFRLGNTTQASGIALLPPGEPNTSEQSTLPMAALGNISGGRLPISPGPANPPPMPNVAKSGTTTVLPRTSAPLHPPVGPTNQPSQADASHPVRPLHPMHSQTSGPLPPLSPMSPPLPRTTDTSLPPLRPEGSGVLRRDPEQRVWSGELRRDY